MWTVSRSIVHMTAMLLCATDAWAQSPQVAVSSPPLARWDVAVSVGLFNKSGAAIDADERTASSTRETQSCGCPSPVYGLDVGHYWTPHLKVDLGFRMTGSFSTFDGEFVRIPELPELPNGAEVFTDKTLTFTSASAAATYQFREGAFIHPYLSAGLRLGWLREHRFRDQRVYTDYIGPFPSKAVPYTASALDEHNMWLRARPFVSAGSKFYLGQRIYLRPEVSVAFSPRVVSDSIGQVSVGSDF